MPQLEYRDVTKIYHAKRKQVIALNHISFGVNQGELVAIVGPSGCGKSTALKILTGIEQPTSGEIWMEGRNITHIPAKDRGIALCFQHSSLYKHLTVRENLHLGLNMLGFPKSQIADQTEIVTQNLAIADLLDRKPKELSGGQRQRVALARAMVRNPKVLLLDEPLSSLDAQLRTAMRAELKRIHLQSKTTMICVTHDQVEAMTLADRIIVMRGGEILQIDTPNQTYAEPKWAWISEFIGSPGAQLVPGTITSNILHCLAGSITTNHISDGNVIVGLRPDKIQITHPNKTSTHGTVQMVETLGEWNLVYITAQGQTITARTDPKTNPPVGSSVGLSLTSTPLLFCPHTQRNLALPQ